MALWVDMVLKPYPKTKPQCICPLLLLDSYQCHMMKLVTSQITALGIDILHVPPGCTPLCQPIDIGVCKPLKVRLKMSKLLFLTCNSGKNIGNCRFQAVESLLGGSAKLSTTSLVAPSRRVGATRT